MIWAPSAAISSRSSARCGHGNVSNAELGVYRIRSSSVDDFFAAHSVWTSDIPRDLTVHAPDGTTVTCPGCLLLAGAPGAPTAVRATTQIRRAQAMPRPGSPESASIRRSRHRERR